MAYYSSISSGSTSYTENMDPTWELISPFMMSMNNPSLLQNQNFDYQNNLMSFCSSSSSDHHQFSVSNHHQTNQIHPDAQVAVLANQNNSQQQAVVSSYGHDHHHHDHHDAEYNKARNNKRKAEEMNENSSFNSSSLSSVHADSATRASPDSAIKKNSSGRGKRVKSNEKKGGEKGEEVVHVRARRGQATDSHSIAERVRRGKINERLRCLQDIVPGCYKTMGMAVMLDEIINYVQSLQNQVEFLSMKLTVASQFYDFNSETEVTDKEQKTKGQSNSQEEQDVQRMISNGGDDHQVLGNFFQPSWPF